MKSIYFFTICFLPILFVPLLPAVFVFRMPFPLGVFPYIAYYFWFGLLVLMIDLIRSDLAKDKKIMWGLLNIFAGIFTLPAYWFLVIRKKSNKLCVATPSKPTN